jgi:hypothetical protein
MNTSQYTIRGIPNALLEKVDSESKRTKRSKNDILLGALKTGLVQDEKKEVKWYEEFLGSMTEEDAKFVDEASRESRQIHPKDLL